MDCNNCVCMLVCRDAQNYEYREKLVLVRLIVLIIFRDQMTLWKKRLRLYLMCAIGPE